MDDHLNNYHLVDEDPRMILAKNLGESGSCTSAINILIHILTAMGASDDFIKSMTDCGTVLSKEINHENCLDIEEYGMYGTCIRKGISYDWRPDA